MATIAAGSIELGPIPFNLYSKDVSGRMVLFCRREFPVIARHIRLLRHNSNRIFYIGSDNMDEYLDYAFERLERIVSSPEITTNDKAQIVHGVGKRIVRKLMEDPRSGETVAQTSRFVDSQVELILCSPDVANYLFALSSTDNYTFSHSINVSTFCVLLGEKIFGRERERLWSLGMGGLLHDVGKTKIDPKIISKPSTLTSGELTLMREHPRHSYELLKGHGLAEPVLEIGLHHHENVCGDGYPDGLSGKEIHQFARLAAAADVYDAITSTRAYRPPSYPLEALSIMTDEIGKFDREVFNALLGIVLHNKKLIAEFWNRSLPATALPKHKETDDLYYCLTQISSKQGVATPAV